MPFSTGIGLERVGIIGSELVLPLGQSDSSGRWIPLQKQETKRIGGARPLPLRCLSQFFFFMKEKINCLEGKCSTYLLPMRWLGIYSICFSQLDDGKDSFPLDKVFSVFIVIGLIRDNEGAVY